MAARLLDLAEWMMDEHPRSSAARRRAISTAYYAVFHEILATCAEVVLGDLDVGDETYERAYRALDHNQIRQAFEVSASPLQQRDSLKAVGELLVPLLSARNRADYAPPIPFPFTRSEAIDLVHQGRQAIELLEALDERDRADLVVHLLFKDRSAADQTPKRWMRK